VKNVKEEKMYSAKLKFPFHVKTKIIYGAGSRKEMKIEMESRGKKRAMVVTDSFLYKNTDFIKNAEEILGNYCVGIFNEVQPDSAFEIVDKGAKIAGEMKIDTVISIGGGSSIDTAKGICAVLSTGKPIKELMGFGGIGISRLFHIAVPTTAGTGSEVTSAAVIKDTSSGRKLILADPAVTPDVAILDPELIMELPPSITAGTGLDALTHAIEAIHSRRRNPVADAYALHAIRLISKNLKECVIKGNIVQRGMTMIAATMAGIAFNSAMVGIVHAIAHTIGGKYNVPHGLANGILLVPSMRFNMDACPDRYIMVAEAFGIERRKDESDNEYLERALNKIERFVSSLGIPVKLREVGVPEDGLEECAQIAMSDPCILTNPKPISDPSEVLKILKSAW
jgi:alcohol dehydrogenase